MPLYRWNPDNLEPVTPTTFQAEGLREREDLQRLLRDQPEVIEEGLFIVAEEFSNWQDSTRSIDLLGLDVEGNLVVIELKRTQTGDHSELQAIRYAAMVANMTLEQIIEAHRVYLSKRGIDEDARSRVLTNLGVTDESDALTSTKRPRIVLVSAGFSNELTTAVLWLRDWGMDITCVRLQLYGYKDGLLMDTTQVIPLPEASDYLVRVREKDEDEQRQRRRYQAEVLPGGELFLEAVGGMPQEAKVTMTDLYEWAMSLEEEGLAEIATRKTSSQPALLLNVPNSNVRFTTIYCTASYGQVGIHGRALERHAPISRIQVVESISPEVLVTDRYLPFEQFRHNGLLEALTDAYREANDLPPTTPRPGSGPDSPPPAE